MGLLRDYEPSNGAFSSTSKHAYAGHGCLVQGCQGWDQQKIISKTRPRTRGWVVVILCSQLARNLLKVGDKFKY